MFDQAKVKGVKGEAFDQLEKSINTPNRVSTNPP